MSPDRKPPRGPLDDGDDAALFRAAIGPVRALPPAATPPQRPKPRPLPRMAARDESEALDEFRRALAADVLEAGDFLSHRQPSLPGRVLQRLRRGDYAAQDELDLHHTDAAPVAEHSQRKSEGRRRLPLARAGVCTQPVNA